MVPSKDYSHAPPGIAGFVCEGRQSEDEQQNPKKKTMKTNQKNQTKGLKNRADQQLNPNTQAERKDQRLPIDREQRQQNRTLPTPKVLNLLIAKLPDVYRVAEVVGKWVWVQFTESPAAEIRQQLSELGFHWNGHRQAWQHPCGLFRDEAFPGDPRRKYRSYFAADEKPV